MKLIKGQTLEHLLRSRPDLAAFLSATPPQAVGASTSNSLAANRMRDS
jgi:hypothetical protein